MKTNELMIGDWVYYKNDNKYHQISSVNMQRDGSVLIAIENDLSFDYMFEPIPLQKVHLAKNGFEFREYTNIIECVFNDGYEVNIYFNAGLPEEDIPPSIFLNIDFVEKSVVMPIEYVHQLQQAMRLMGCDKEIEL